MHLFHCRSLASILGLLLMHFPASHVQADLVTLHPTAGGDIQNILDIVDVSNPRIRMSQSGSAERRIVMEFDMMGLTAGMTIDSAVLALTKDGTFSNIGSVLPVHVTAYLGDGIVSLDDFDAPSAMNVGDFVLDNTVVPANGTEFLFPLIDLAPLQTAFDSPSQLLTLRLETDSFATLNFASLETGTSFAAPELRLNLSAVPEPSSAILICFVATAVMGWRQRRV